MAEGKKSFVLYSDIRNTVVKLPPQKQAELFMLILDYVNDLDPETDDLLLQIAFEPIKLQLKRDLKKWDSLREKRSEAGKIGGLKSGEARASKTKQNEANEAVNATANVNETVNEILLKKEPKKKSKKKLIDYSISLEERKEKFSAEAFSNAKYDKEMIKKFIRYWTEPTLDKEKMRFEIVIEKNKTWSMSGRLATWSENNFNKPQNGTGKKSVDEAVRDLLNH